MAARQDRPYSYPPLSRGLGPRPSVDRLLRRIMGTSDFVFVVLRCIVLIYYIDFVMDFREAAERQGGTSYFRWNRVETG